MIDMLEESEVQFMKIPASKWMKAVMAANALEEHGISLIQVSFISGKMAISTTDDKRAAEVLKDIGMEYKPEVVA
jgi:hypothetical protein